MRDIVGVSIWFLSAMSDNSSPKWGGKEHLEGEAGPHVCHLYHSIDYERAGLPRGVKENMDAVSAPHPFPGEGEGSAPAWQWEQP